MLAIGRPRAPRTSPTPTHSIWSNLHRPRDQLLDGLHGHPPRTDTQAEGDETLRIRANISLFGVGVHSEKFAVLTIMDNDVAVPDAITDLSASPGDGQATLSWTVPGDGGSAITKFKYRQKTSGSYGNWLGISGMRR